LELLAAGTAADVEPAEPIKPANNTPAAPRVPIVRRNIMMFPSVLIRVSTISLSLAKQLIIELYPPMMIALVKPGQMFVTYL
jgi:hypothetical protein